MVIMENRKLIASVCTVNFLSFAVGNAYAWSSTALTSLNSVDLNRNPLGRPVTPFETSWIVSLVSLGAACGPFLAGYCSAKYGRKATLLAFALPMLMCHVILTFASSPLEFYVARFMLGLGVGSIFTIVPIYVGEISETKIRGFLGSIMGISISLGLLFVYTVGPFVSLRLLSYILMVPIVSFIIVFGIFVPESPYFYVSKGDDLAAEISLNKLRNSQSNLKELAEIKKTVQDSKGGDLRLCDALMTRSFKKGIITTTSLMVFQQFVGITIILSYMETIFISSGSTMSSSVSTIIVGLIQTFVVVLSSSLIDKWGRRLLLIISSAGCALPLFTLGLYFFMKNRGDDVSSLWWLPISSLIVFMISFNFGLGSLPWILVGELFSSRTKSLASSITATTCLSLAFLSSLILPKFVELVGFEGVFWFFAGSALKCLIFVLWYVPETKEKTFQEIQLILEK